MSIAVLVADEHRLLREGLRALLEREPDLRVVAEAPDGARAVALAAELRPDVVITGIHMAVLDGIEATRRIVLDRPGTAVLVVSRYADRRHIADSLRAGAHGYLLKDCGSEELVHAVRFVASGGTYLSPAIAGEAVEGLAAGAGGHPGSGPRRLTLREREVLTKLAEGARTGEIAAALGISPRTVETHRQNLMAKVGAPTVAALIRFAMREGLVED